MNAKKYNRIKLLAGISKSIITFVLILGFVSFGYSTSLLNNIKSILETDYFQLILFTAITGVALSVLFFPLKYYTEYYLEHKYKLSNQNISRWLWEDFKSMLIGTAVGVPVLLAFFYLLKEFGNLWWLPFSVLMFFISVILAQIVPVIILPLFYKISPINNPELKSRITEMAEKVGMKVDSVFSFDMSKNTKKANAAFTGLGKTKRILLGDTLLNEYSNDEIETVVAHELGHYKHNHIMKNIIIGTLNSFLMFFSIALLYDYSLSWFGFSNLYDIDALPLITIWAMLIGLIITPVGNMISRKFEYEADHYAVVSTNKKDDFVNTLNKLTKQNMGDQEPHWFVEWFFYSHPSVKKRIKKVNTLQTH
ncbi:MAG: M48 family metallopeptidase [Melioribacteraceae bacterium]|nr:M48 family metallopeptidase [Melioribacteraceae bacterium]